MLFYQYTCGTKVNGDIELAASEIIAERGTRNGFWKVILEELRKVDTPYKEERFVRILGMMLDTDANMRDFIESKRAGEMQVACIVYLPKEVVSELINRAQKANKYLLDAYVIALCRARDSRTTGFFVETLNNNSYDDSVHFHAALGLAEIKNNIGIEWLIAHSDDSTQPVNLCWPNLAKDHYLGSCAISALKPLTGQSSLNSKSDFEAWWSKTSGNWALKYNPYLVYR